MANYCSNCGASVDPSAAYCSSCGCALNGTGASTGGTTSASTGKTVATAAAGVLGTLVAVNLVGGLTRQLYYYRGRYFLDPYCRRPFGSPHMIIGGHRPIHGGMHRPPMGGPHGGMHGPMGGPRGGGPHGRR